MQRSKKHLLGIGGLALVGAMTAYAFTIPAPEANAASVSGQVQISVDIHGEVPDIDVTRPASGTITLDHNMTIGLYYSQTNKISYTLTNTTTGTSVSGSYNPSSHDGSDSLPFDLNSSNLGFGRYRFEATANDGADYARTMFYYIPLRMTTVGNAEENNDPIVELEHAAGVYTVDLQAYNSEGNPLFTTPISVTIADPSAVGTQQVTLPFTSFGAASGDYRIVAIPRDASGTALATVTGAVETNVKYTAPGSPVVPDTDNVPDVPKTGGFFAELNLSRTDYLLTGLIVFGAATVLAFVVLRKQKSNKR